MKKNLFIIYFIIFFGIAPYSYSEDKEFNIEAKKVYFKKKNNLIVAEGKAEAWDNKNRKIQSDKIIYNKNKQTIKAIGNAKFSDGKNLITANEFLYDLNNKSLTANKKVFYIDKNKNEYQLDTLTYYESLQKLKGYNARIKFKDGSNFISSNLEIDEKKGLSFFKDSYYTTCKKINSDSNEYCPSWSLNSKNIIHDKVNKKIIHKNSIFRLKNFPILYTPYLTHPDPSVKRQSGFLAPSISSVTSLGKTIKAPYFFALNEDKDLTLTPILYLNQKHMINAGYRQAFKNSFLQIETSYFGGYNKNSVESGSRNYFFLAYDREIENNYYNVNKFNIYLQRVSQKDYLKNNKLRTKLFDENIRILKNSINYVSTKKNSRFEIGSNVFEDLNASEKNKYTYVFPEGSYSLFKKFDNDLKANFSTTFLSKKFLDDQKKQNINNNIKFSTKSFVSSIGTSTIYTANFSNHNTKNNNIYDQKNGNNFDNNFTFAFDTIFPLAKYKKLNIQTFTPRLFGKYTTGNTKNISEKKRILEFNDIFLLNRTGSYETIDTGYTLGYGIEYTNRIKNSENENQIISNLEFGQVLNGKQNLNMPNQSSLNNKSSDFVGSAKIAIFGNKNKLENSYISDQNKFNQNLFETGYKFNLNNNLDKLNRNQLNIKTVYNKFLLDMNFDEKNSHVGSERLLVSEISKLVGDNYYFSFKNTKDLITNSSRNQNFSFNYENECLIASFGLSKDFYTDSNLLSNGNKSIFFNIIIKPFGETLSPDLSGFIN